MFTSPLGLFLIWRKYMSDPLNHVYIAQVSPQPCCGDTCEIYRQVFNIRCTKSKHSQDSRTVLRLSLPNPLKPDVKEDVVGAAPTGYAPTTSE